MDFRLFLLRHVPLLRVLFRWTIRLLLPRQSWKSRLAYLHAAREHLATGLHPSVVQTLEWLFAERKRLAEPGAAPADARYLDASSAYRTPRFRALYGQWLDDPRNTHTAPSIITVEPARAAARARRSLDSDSVNRAVTRARATKRTPEARRHCVSS
jgi:hypothetical protein